MASKWIDTHFVYLLQVGGVIRPLIFYLVALNRHTCNQKMFEFVFLNKLLLFFILHYKILMAELPFTCILFQYILGFLDYMDSRHL